MRRFPSLICTAAVLLAVSVQQHASGLGFEAFGPDEHAPASDDWPDGIRTLLTHPSRVYYQDFNGHGQVHFAGSIIHANELIKLFGNLDLKRHRVIFRVGEAATNSFDGRKMAYDVKLDLPGGFPILNARANVTTGLYATTPTLEVNVSDDWLDELNRLEISDHVQLHRSQYELADLLKSASEGDPSSRWRALSLIRELRVDNDSTRRVLEASVQESDPKVRRHASEAIAALDKQKSITAELRTAFNEFVDNHPRTYRTPTPESVFEQLRQADERYAREGFAAKGTLVDHEGVLMNWAVTMGDGRLAATQVVADENATGQIEHSVYVTPTEMVFIRRSQRRSNGVLTKATPVTYRKPTGSAFDLMIGRFMWPLGRDFTRRIDRVESVRDQYDGSLLAVASFGSDWQWELKVDPYSDYLVQQARRLRRFEQPTYLIDGAGALNANGRSTNHTARWRESENSLPTSIAVSEVLAETDHELLNNLEEAARE